MTDFVAVTEVSSNDLISHPHYVTPPTNGDGISAFARSEGNRIETIHHDDKKAHNSLTTTEREKIVGDNAHNSSSTLDIDSSQRLVLRIDIPAKKNQDRGRHWVLPGDVFVYAVADGHGRKGDGLAESTMFSLDVALTGTTRASWSEEDDLTAQLRLMFQHAENRCASYFGSCDGGATLSVCVDRPGRDLWVAHVGDSDVCLVDLAPESSSATMLTDDHSPLNLDEFLRMTALCPSAKFEYDRQRKDGPPLQIYSAAPQEPGGWKKNLTPTRNVYYKNRANELATYVSEGGGGCSSLANTRAIGDFRMKRAVGLSAEPFVARHPPLSRSQRLVVASDGFWDSWPTAELLQFCAERSQGFGCVVADLERTHVTTTNKYFGSCSDDTLLYFIQPVEQAPSSSPS